MRRWLTRYRVTLGFALAGLVLWQASPTSVSWTLGAALAAAGASLRIWAAGHLEKGREVTMSGPYRWTRHPLYLGSSAIGAGVAVASANLVVTLLVGVYLASTLTAACASEEAHLRATFGEAYDDYARRRVVPPPRRFSLKRALGNREHHALAGLIAGFLLLAAKVR